MVRDVYIAAEGVDVHLYIADGVYMGYDVTGTNPYYRTPEGVGLGSSESELLDAYGAELETGPSISGAGDERIASVDQGNVLPTKFRYRIGEPVDRVVVGARCAL